MTAQAKQTHREVSARCEHAMRRMRSHAPPCPLVQPCANSCSGDDGGYMMRTGGRPTSAVMEGGDALMGEQQ